MNIKIVVDSASDVLAIEGVPFEVAPLKVITSEREYVDNENLDVLEMVTELKSYKGRSGSSCPNSGDWIAAFGDAQYVVCFTITATLSGSYNSAMVAKRTYEENHPGRCVFVVNSLSAGPEIALMAQKAAELIKSGMDYDDICTALDEYTHSTGLLFVLESLTNFANNGRVSPMIAKMTGLLGIRLIGRASDKGDLEPLAKCRGEAKALTEIIKQLGDHGFDHGIVQIHHCFNEEAAKKLRDMIIKQFPKSTVRIGTCRGLCSFYAELGGLLIGFEKM